jgi:hypothetical protein
MVGNDRPGTFYNSVMKKIGEEQTRDFFRLFYPQVAVYNGFGAQDDPVNFACKVPTK